MVGGSNDGRTALFTVGEDGALSIKTVIVHSAPILHAVFAGKGESTVLTISADGSVVVQGENPVTGLEGPLDQVWVSCDAGTCGSGSQGHSGAYIGGRGQSPTP